MTVELLTSPVACDACGGSTVRRSARTLAIPGTDEHAACRVPLAYHVTNSAANDGTYCGVCYNSGEPVGTYVAEGKLPPACFARPDAEVK
jgi:hypothetical protein